jgi:putative transposase
MAFLPPYSPDLNPVEFPWAWLKRHALANFCPANLDELNVAVRNKLKSAQHRPSIIAACWVQAGLWKAPRAAQPTQQLHAADVGCARAPSG